MHTNVILTNKIENMHTHTT